MFIENENTLFPDEAHPLYTEDKDVTQGIIYRLNSRFDHVKKHGNGFGRKYTKNKVADLLKVPKSTFYKWCEESPGEFTADQVCQISQLLGLDLESHWLRYGDEHQYNLTAQEMARAYELLSTNDRRLVSDLVNRLLPDNTGGHVYAIWNRVPLAMDEPDEPEE